MTKAKLIVWIDWDSDKTGVGANLPGPNAVEIDIEVNEGDKPIKIEITDSTFSMNTPHEPKFVVMPEEASNAEERPISQLPEPAPERSASPGQ